MRFLKRNRINNFEFILKKYFSREEKIHSLEPLAQLIESLRKVDFDLFLEFLRENDTIREHFSKYIEIVFEGKSFSRSITEANILAENSFFSELKKRLLFKVLPPVEDENTVSHIIPNVFLSPKKDWDYVKKIEDHQAIELFILLGIDRLIANKNVKKELLLSINILIMRAIGSVLEVEVINMAPEYKNFDNPFFAFHKELDLLTNEFQENPNLELHTKDVSYKQLRIYLEQCFNFVNVSFKNASKYGISSKINQSLLKIRQQLRRIEDVLPLLVIDTEEDYVRNSNKLVAKILEYKSHKNNVRELIRESTTLLSHLITSHTAQAGTHYITSNRKEYIKMFWNASGGGVIVGFLCVFKMLYSYSPSSEFMHAVLYSFNYAMGFVVIYLLHFTLATKQPAMTAATMARVLTEDREGDKNYVGFAHLVSKLFRTQFIAFVGNVLWAFPVTLAIIYGLDVFLGDNFAYEKSDKLLRDLDFVESKAILHACIAGVFLFISGIISGNISNNSVFYKIPQRIAHHPRLNKVLGENIMRKLSIFYAKNWAGIASNFWFGIFLGATAPIGVFLGLDLDIRHITFAAGNFALGLYGKGFDISKYTFWISFFTVFIIGFFNFIVSFGLSMFLAFRSRKVNPGEFRKISKEIFVYFKRNPMVFFFPIKSQLDAEAKDLLHDSTKESKDH